jgi:hypothetical protein
MTKTYVVLEISVMRAFWPTVFNNRSYNTYIELITENYQHAYAPQTAAYSGTVLIRAVPGYHSIGWVRYKIY